ncbi:MAG: DUF4238 domain-containing protein [Longimicrobiaceae bacterium]
MTPPGHPKQQHYVPRFLLKEFGSGKKHRLYTYDKQTDRVFQTNPDKVAAENGFYDFTLEGSTFTAEPAMGSLETATAPVVKRILREESLASLTDEERRLLSLFVAVQYTRTRNFRDTLSDLSRRMAEWLRGAGADAEGLEMTEDDAAAMSVQMALDAHEFAPHIYDKAWLLLKNPTATPFYTSDNPVTFQNLDDFGPYGNIGLAVPGIEIYLPLGSRLCLSMLCRTREEQARDGIRKVEQLQRTLPQRGRELESHALRARQIVAAFDEGVPLLQDRDNVLNVNSLQVRYSARYVYSGTDDFSLVRTMLRDHPRLRTGPRLRVG